MDTNTWLAIFGTAILGGILKIVESWLSKNKNKDDTAIVLRNELRKDLEDLRGEIRTAEKDSDTWREKYYLLKEEYLGIKSELDSLKGQN